MRASEEYLTEATEAYVRAALDQDAGTEEGETLREAGFDESSFSDEVRAAIREDVAALAWEFRDELEGVPAEKLGGLLWFERAYADGTTEAGVNADLAERMGAASRALGTLDFWPGGNGVLEAERAPPFDGEDRGEAMREAARGKARGPRI